MSKSANQGKPALVVSAHCADFVWRAGGAIALQQMHGGAVTIVCLSYGERGESAALWKQGAATLQKVKAARKREAEAAAAALGAHDILFLDLGDYPLELNKKNICELADIMRRVRPAFALSHSRQDPHNADHALALNATLKARMVAQAWGHKPGSAPPIGAPQVYMFEPHQTEQAHWKPDTILDITPVWEKKRAAIECMAGQQHLWQYYANAAQNRANHFRRNSGGQAGGRNAQYAEAFESVFPRAVDFL